MGQITSLFIWKVIGIVDDSIDRHAVLRAMGIDPGSPVDPDRMVEDTVYYGFLEQLASLDPNGTTLPLRAGASMRCDDYGVFGLTCLGHRCAAMTTAFSASPAWRWRRCAGRKSRA